MVDQFIRIYLRNKKIGKILEGFDWRESNNKPNLFYKKISDIAVFADMRGTEEIPIWEEPYPYIYASEGPAWKRRKAMNETSQELDNAEIEYRYSFYDENELDGLFFGPDDELPDGTCKMCGRDIELGDMNIALFCSGYCETAYSQLKEMRREESINNVKCALCAKPLGLWDKDTIRHHIMYQPEEKTIFVCRSCHMKIHLNHQNYPELAPNRPPDWRQYNNNINEVNIDEQDDENYIYKNYDRSLDCIDEFINSNNKEMLIQDKEDYESIAYYLNKIIIEKNLLGKLKIEIVNKKIHLLKK